MPEVAPGGSVGQWSQPNRNSAMTTTQPAPVRSQRSTGRRVLAVGAVVVGGLLVLGGVDRMSQDTATTTDAVDAPGIEALAIRTTAGEVTVTATDRDDIHVVARTTSGLFSDADADVRVDGDQLVLAGDCDGIGIGTCTVAFDVQLPRDRALPVEVHTTAGEIELRGLAQDVDVRTTAGRVQLLDFAGPSAHVATTAGSIEVVATADVDRLDLRTTAGSIEVAIDDTEPLRVDVATTVGSQSVSVDQAADADREVTARTTAGEIRITGR